MTIDGKTGLRGAGRLGLRGMAAMLAAHVFVYPLPLAAQQATSESTNWLAAADDSQTRRKGYPASHGSDGSHGTQYRHRSDDDGHHSAAPGPRNRPASCRHRSLGRGFRSAKSTRNAPRKPDCIAHPAQRRRGYGHPARHPCPASFPEPADRHRTGKTASGSERRVFSETGLKGTLTSDWSRHELTIAAKAHGRKRFRATAPTNPRARIDANPAPGPRRRHHCQHHGCIQLQPRGYQRSQRDYGSERPVGRAPVRRGVSLERDLGLLRGSIATQASRYLYSDAELSNGTTLDRSDRDRTRATISARLGVELSTAITPFIEATTGKLIYDDSVDSSGYRRSADIYGAKTGVTVDLGEKLRGEVAVGYEHSASMTVVWPTCPLSLSMEAFSGHHAKAQPST